MGVLHHSFDRGYEIELEAIGDGIVNEESFEGSLDRIYAAFQEHYSRFPADISLSIRNSLSAPFTEVDPAFLERITALKELILPDSISEIKTTEKLLAVFRGNNTLIRGNFGSFAENFAEMHGLNFRPADLLLAKYEDERAHETTYYTLIFRRSGSIAIEMEVSSSGSSAGNTFGGKFYHELPDKFWKTMNAEEVCKSHTEELLKNGRLARFMEAARARDNIFTGEN